MTDYVGQQLGNYRLRQLLARGGFADVYLGEHIHLGTLAAIKVLPIYIKSDELANFRREARIIAHLQHPHIVRVLDFGVENDMLFLVMDYAQNGTIRRCHPKGTRVPLPTVLSYAQQVAQALQYAHEQKIVHRDVKPENMLLDSNNQVLLSDFGISSIEQNTSAAVTLSQVGSNAAGTIYYMAPEQIQSSARPASDQYSLAVVVYEWLCGSRPFTGETLAVLYKHMHALPPSLHEQNPAISAEVEQVVRRALAKDPQQRFATVTEFSRALEEASHATDALTLLMQSRPRQVLMNGIPSQVASQAQEATAPLERPRAQQTVPGHTPTPKAHLKREAAAILAPVQPDTTRQPLSLVKPPYQRKKPPLSRGVATLLIGLLLTLIAGSVAFALVSTHVDSHATSQGNTTATAEAHTQATEAANVQATAAASTAAINAYNTGTANGVMAGFDSQHSRVNLYEKILAPTNVAQVKQAWNHVTGGSIGSAATVANGMVYINSSDEYMYALDATTGSVKWKAPIGSYDFGCAPTVANGTVYMGSFDFSLYALDAKTGTIRWTAKTGGRIGSSPTLSQGIIYVGSDDGKLYAFKAADGTPLWSVATGSDIRSSPAVANGIVYVGSDDHKLYAIDAATHVILWQKTTGDQIRSSPSVVNGVVYVGSKDGNLYAFDAADGTIRWTFQTGSATESSPAVSNHVVYIGSGNGKLYALDASQGTLLWAATTDGGIHSSPTIANGVLYIGSNDHKLYAFSAASCGSPFCSPIVTFSTKNQVVSSPTVANGVMYVGSDDGNLYAFHL